MNSPEKPPLDPYTYERIEVELHGTDTNWWKELTPLVVVISFLPGGSDTGLAPPKQPIQLRKNLEAYALMLFSEEYSYYPKESPFVRHWMEKLAERVEVRVMGLVSKLETSNPFNILERRSLTYHGISHEEMRQAVREALKAKIDHDVPDSRQELSTTVDAYETKTDKPKETSPNAEVERRTKLLAEYKAATGNPSDYKIYNAENSGIHKAEFYDWKNGKLPSQSKTAKNLESFLREKKSPIPRKS